jgi:hypothetical protein
MNLRPTKITLAEMRDSGERGATIRLSIAFRACVFVCIEIESHSRLEEN